jgi:hypothetical protein
MPFSLALSRLATTAALLVTLRSFLPTADGMVGHDYRYFFPYLLSGPPVAFTTRLANASLFYTEFLWRNSLAGEPPIHRVFGTASP